MKIVLISTPVMDFVQGELRPIAYDLTRECPPYGLYLLSTILSQNNHEVVLIDLIANSSNEIDKYRKEIEDCSLVGISATSLSWPTATNIISQVRSISKQMKIVVGGVHPSMFPEYILRTFDVNFVLCGEAEITLLQLCNALDKSQPLDNISGLVRCSSRQIIYNSSSCRLTQKDLNKFPPADYEKLPINAYKGLSIESSRGCKYNCIFCSATYRRKWVPLNPIKFVNNIETMLPDLDKTILKLFYVVDDEFSTDPARSISITNELRERNISIKLTYDSRVTDLLYDGFLENMKEFTGQLLVGAECGYDAGLKNIGKGITTNEIIRAAKALSNHGLSTKADFSFIIGFPWEDFNDIKKTLQLAGYIFSEFGVRILIQWYIQMPNSKLWTDYRKKEIVNESMYDNFGYFRNLYLFRSANNLKPSEIWEISRLIQTLKVLSSLAYPKKQMIEHSLPLSIYENYPEESFNVKDIFNKVQ